MSEYEVTLHPNAFRSKVGTGTVISFEILQHECLFLFHDSGIFWGLIFSYRQLPQNV
jgi:hypothetical protein